ncbi:MAG TPA: acyl carrier protein [Fimbriimonadales bacterium]|jgi:acyl carrier protein|nr:acyl carrier protein [Fimbriimonadales bacterium]
MDEATVLEKVKKVIVEEMDRKEDEITLESSFTEDFGADSLDVVQLVMGFEDAFDIEIPDEDVEQIKTVGAAVDYIKKKLEEKSA